MAVKISKEAIHQNVTEVGPRYSQYRIVGCGRKDPGSRISPETELSAVRAVSSLSAVADFGVSDQSRKLAGCIDAMLSLPVGGCIRGCEEVPQRMSALCAESAVRIEEPAAAQDRADLR